MVFQWERQQQWEEGTRLCIVYSSLTLPGHPEYLSLSGGCRLPCGGPVQIVFGIIPSWMSSSSRLRGSNEWQLERIWYYATHWTAYRFTGWGFNGFLCTNRMRRSHITWCVRWEAWVHWVHRQVWHFDVSERLRSIKSLKHIQILYWNYHLELN